MRATTALAIAAMLAGGILATHAGWAQTNPTAGDIVKSLTPDGKDVTTRGIRVAPQGGAAGHAAAAPAASLHVEFPLGSAELTPAATRTLDELGKALTASQLASYRFRVEGHTDTVGSAQLNQALSERRAENVVSYLEGKYGISSTRLQAVGMGEQGLAVPTPENTPEPRNRRVVVVNIGS